MRILALQTLIGGFDNGRVEKSNIANRPGIVIDTLRCKCFVLIKKERLRINTAQPHRRSRGIDVVLDIQRLTRRFLGLDNKPLNECWIPNTCNDGNQRPKANCNDWKSPSATPDVDDEKAERQQRNKKQQVDNWKLRLYVGVGRTVDCAPS